MNTASARLMLALLFSPAAFAEPEAATTCWFDRPANSFLESCPVGNGRLGAMDFGGAEEHRIVLNESSVWSGGYYEGNRPDDSQNLARGRELYFSGDVPAAQDWFARKFQYPDGVVGWWNADQFGCYQILADLILRARGNVIVDLEWKDGRVTAYRLASPDPRPVNVLVNGKQETRTQEKT